MRLIAGGISAALLLLLIGYMIGYGVALYRYDKGERKI